METASFSGSFGPIVQYEKWEIHPVFPHFPYFRLGQNLPPNLLAPLCGVALISIYDDSIAVPVDFGKRICYNTVVFFKLQRGNYDTKAGTGGLHLSYHHRCHGSGKLVQRLRRADDPRAGGNHGGLRAGLVRVTGAGKNLDRRYENCRDPGAGRISPDDLRKL